MMRQKDKERALTANQGGRLEVAKYENELTMPDRPAMRLALDVDMM